MIKLKKNFVSHVPVNKNLLKELISIQKKYPPKDQNSKLFNSNMFKKFIINCEKKIRFSNKKALVLSFNRNNKYKIDHILMKNITFSASKILGRLIIQNKEGNKLVVVYDRNRKFSIDKGARYHQTREGGSIHTDNVNVSLKWDYMILSCLSPGLVGGETILVSAKDNYILGRYMTL